MKKRTFLSLLLLFALGFGYGSWKILSYYREESSASDLYANLAWQVTAPAEASVDENAQTDAETEENAVLEEYASLLAENPDMVGWISIEGTAVNYPVVQSPYEPNFYLTHGFDKLESNYGCPYVQENCDVETPSDNVVMYGHHMRNGSMFAGLIDYQEEIFWKEHPIIRFDTLTQRHEYEVLAVLTTHADDNGLPYRQFVNARDADDFSAFVERCKRVAYYDTGVTAEYGDHLITLSTCKSSSDPTSRFIVVAKRMV